MDLAFNYDADETSDEVVRGIAAQMSDSALKPLTDAEIAERQEWLAEYRARVEQQNIAAEQRRAEKERQQALDRENVRRQAAAEAREKAQRERSADIGRQVRNRTLSYLRLHAAGQERRQRELENALRHSARQQYTNSLMAELDRAINEPKSEPSNFAARYRENQRSGWYYVTPEDSDE
jgi:hypothetical protein